VLRAVPARLRQQLGFRNPRALHFDVDRLPMPDSSTAKAAEELCRGAASPMILDHSLRTYAWATLLGRADGLRPDAELLYVTSLLHDMAITDRYREHAPMPCFAARGGILARDWAKERGWPAPHCASLGDAISLHLNVAVSREHGPEARLLQEGAALDMIGLRLWDLSPGTVAAVLGRYPRHALKRDGPALFLAECHPRTRAHLLSRWLLFPTMTRYAPFDE